MLQLINAYTGNRASGTVVRLRDLVSRPQAGFGKQFHDFVVSPDNHTRLKYFGCDNSSSLYVWT